MKYRLEAGHHTLVVECGEDLAKQAQSLLKMLARDDATLHEGSIVEFGWAPLKLVAGSDGIEIWEPDFQRDPAEFRAGADTVLRVLAKQAAVTHACGARSRAARFDHLVHVERDALGRPRIGLVRLEPMHAHDSGWHVGALDAGGSRQHEETAIPVYRLLQQQPSVMKALALPVGYRVAIDDSEIIEVLDAEGRSVWPFAHASGAGTVQ
jgi:hypothetical protein